MRSEAELIRQALAPLLPAFAVEVLPQLDSTNSELMRRGRARLTGPVLLVALQQTAGRGRLGRAWQSAGDSLTFSLGLMLAPADWSGLSLAVGLSVAESLDPAHRVPVSLKWPNDLWVDDCKLGGILIETALPSVAGALRYLVIGIGLNIGTRSPEGLSTAPVWVQQWAPDASAPELLHTLVEPLVRAILRFGEQGFKPFAAGFAARDALRGREVQLSDGMVGRCDGVGPAGELQVQTVHGLQTITSSEVSVRPRSMASGA